MSLLPYLLGCEVRPRRHRHQIFDVDILDDLLDRPSLQLQRYLAPLQRMSSALQDVGSTIKSDKDKFQINLDVQHFAPEEISVTTDDDFVVVEAKHEEKEDGHGYVSRQFKRRYALPEGCKADSVESRLSSDGVLSIIAPKKALKDGVRAIPITQTGPVRRKHADEAVEDSAKDNGEMDVEISTQQKKKKRNV